MVVCADKDAEQAELVEKILPQVTDRLESYFEKWLSQRICENTDHSIRNTLKELVQEEVETQTQLVCREELLE